MTRSVPIRAGGSRVVVAWELGCTWMVGLTGERFWVTLRLSDETTRGNMVGGTFLKSLELKPE